jgi:hypothetical protein
MNRSWRFHSAAGDFDPPRFDRRRRSRERCFSGSGVQSSGLGGGDRGKRLLFDRYRSGGRRSIIGTSGLNKARWNSQMRMAFDQNMMVIDAAVSDQWTPEPESAR